MTKKPTNNNEDVVAKISKDRVLRRHMGYESHYMFFVMYFAHYIKYAIAEFHKDIFRITEDTRHTLACIVAFRGSGKSTLITFSYAIWAVLGVQQKKFVLIICQTQAQAKQHMANLKYELEHNTLLKSDMGPFREEIGVGEWAMGSLVFRNTGARITIASIDQSIRGVRHRQYRPDLIILDDIENTDSTRTFESRNKIAEWFSREIVPLGDMGTRIMMVGNLVHEDSLMMRIKHKMDDNEINGIYKWFPLIDDKGICLWPEKFDTPEKIEELRLRVGNDIAWQQEYLLHAVSDTARAVAPEWIQYYDEPLVLKERCPLEYAAVDLAISEKDTADYTAIVSATMTGLNGTKHLYIHPNPINNRVSFPDAITCMKTVGESLGENGLMFIEATGFQEGYIQQLTRDGFQKVVGVKPMTDKRSRLALTGELIKNGTILFPRTGCELLIAQITNFGNERHDDLADAFSMLVTHAISYKRSIISFDDYFFA
jgi:predicted phage terminase large subunit-like protein